MRWGGERIGLEYFVSAPQVTGSLPGESLCTGRKVKNHTFQHINCESKYSAKAKLVPPANL